MIRRFLVTATALMFGVSAYALDTQTCNANNLCIQPITWNMIGLDSNDVNSGPAEFMVGARACNNGPTTLTNVASTFSWLSANSYISLSDDPVIAIPELKPGRCYDYYYNGLISRTAAAYFTARQYRVTVTADQDATGVSTPLNRELYIEKLVSQGRNSVNSITGPTDVQVGGIYTYRVDWSTATGGYDQIEHFVNLQNTAFRLIDSHTTYSAPAGGTNDGIYGDGCNWNDVIGSAGYRNCSADKNDGDYPGGVGGDPIVTWFTVQILGATPPGGSPLTTLIYDYSGSSYHYNSNFNSASNALQVVARAAADLRVTITDTPDPATMGGSITYSGAVTNAGLSPVLSTDNPQLTFTLPPNTSFTSIVFRNPDNSINNLWTCSASGTLVTCTTTDQMDDENPLTKGTFDPYQVTYQMVATLTSTATPGSLMTATASLSSNVQDPNPANNTASTSTTYAAATDADMSVTSTVDKPTVVTGTSATFTQVIRNNGPATATSPTFTTTIPAGTTLTSFTDPAGFTCNDPVAGTPGPFTVTCTATSLASGASATATFTVTATAAAGSTLTSTANVTSSTGDPVSANNTASSSVNVVAPGQTDLAITTIATPDPVVAGESILYSQCIRNNGPITATNVVYTMTTPPNTTFAYIDYPAGWTCTAPNPGGTGTITCTKPSLAVDPNACEMIYVTVNVSPLATNPINYSATVTATQPDPIVPNSASYSTLIASSTSSDIGVSKSGPASGTYGQHMTYTISAINNGPSNTTTAFSIVDQLPSGATFVSAVSSRGTCTTSGSSPTTVTCTVPAGLVVGGVVTVTVTVNPTVSPATLQNTASISYPGDPRSGNNLSSVVTTEIIAATAVRTLSADLVEKNGKVEISWRTGYEINNIGFNVYRETGASRTKVSKSVIAGSALVAGKGVVLPAGFSYKWTDRAPVAGARYWIEDLDLDGTRTLHGPFTPRTAASARSLSADSLSTDSPTFASIAAKGASGNARAVPTLDIAGDAVSDVTLARQFDLAGRSAARILAGEEGWYRITKQQLAAAGWDAGTDPRTLEMYVDAVEVPIAVNDGGDGRFDTADSIDFYALGMDTTYSGTRTYWLLNGQNGRRFAAKEKVKATPYAAASFTHTLERKDRFVYFAAQTGAADTDSFYGPVVYWEPTPQAFDVKNIDRAGGNASVEVIIQGATYEPHRVRVDVNGRNVGIVEFDGQASGRATYQFPNAWLNEGSNEVTLLGLNGWGDISFVDRVRLSFPHTYAADDDVLRFPMTGATEATVTGFTTADIRVLDVTDPKQPQEVEAKVSPRGTGFAVTVAPHSKGARILYAATASRVKVPAGVNGNQPSTLASQHNAADFLIITHKSFSRALSPLVAKRTSEGLSTALVDVEDVYDEFGFGSKSPDSIRAFLQHTQSRWKKAPRWVLLVGDATFDPRNYVGNGANDFVPTRIVPTKYMKTAFDDWMADFDGDLVPNVHLGRLSVTTAEEAEAVVSKIVNFRPQARSVLLVADRNDTADFERFATATRTTIPGSMAVTELMMGGQRDPRGAFFSALATRPGVVNYVGHGSIEGLSNLDFFRTGDVASLAGNQSLPFWVLMDCLNVMFHDVWTYSLGEALLRVPNGGAIAVWGSSGMSDPAQQNTMNRAFWNLVGSRPGATLGELVTSAKAATSDAEVRKTWTLLGDPTLRLQ